MRLLVTGSRGYPRKRVWQVLNDWVSETDSRDLDFPENITVVQGGCPNSPDVWAALWAEGGGYQIDPMKADWSKHGKAAGPIRNSRSVCESTSRDSLLSSTTSTRAP